MKRVILIVTGWVVVLAGTQPVSARVPEEREPVYLIYEIRAGTMWERGKTPPELNYTRPSFEGGIVLGGGHGPITRRLSLQLTAGTTYGGSTEYLDPVLNSPARLSRNLLMLNPALGLDVVQSNRVDVTVRYGGAVLVNYTKLELRGDAGWDDVCHLEAFKGACPDRWSFLGNGDAGIRFYPKKGGEFFFGVDYTRYAGSKNQLIRTIGLRHWPLGAARTCPAADPPLWLPEAYITCAGRY